MAVGQSVYKLWIYGEFMCKVTGYLQGKLTIDSILEFKVIMGDDISWPFCKV